MEASLPVRFFTSWEVERKENSSFAAVHQSHRHRFCSFFFNATAQHVFDDLQRLKRKGLFAKHVAQSVWLSNVKVQSFGF